MRTTESAPVVAHIDQSGADDCDLLVLLRHCLGRLLFYSIGRQPQRPRGLGPARADERV
jgi:hypothetical protein